VKLGRDNIGAAVIAFFRVSKVVCAPSLHWKESFLRRVVKGLLIIP